MLLVAGSQTGVERRWYSASGSVTEENTASGAFTTLAYWAQELSFVDLALHGLSKVSIPKPRLVLQDFWKG